MIDDIFKRWIETNNITQEDIIPILVEWNHLVGDGRATPETAALFCSVVQTDYNSMINRALHDIGIKKGYSWYEIVDKNNNIIRRELYKPKE